MATQSVCESESFKILTRRRRSKGLETPTASEGEASGQKSAAVYTKKRKSPSIEVETLNHTRRIERPLTEILTVAPMYQGSNSKGDGKNAPSVQNSNIKKLRVNQVRLTIPAKFRD